MSAVSLRIGPHSTPSRAVQLVAQAPSDRPTPAVRLHRYRAWASSADHRPSGPRVRLATSTWVCSCGSPARLVRCRNPAATNPAAGQPAGPEPSLAPARRGPVVGAATHEARLPLQPRQRRLDRSVGCLDDLTAHQRITQRVQHRHPLRGREREIEARHPAASTSATAPRSGSARCPGAARPAPPAARRRRRHRRRARARRGRAQPPARRLAPPRVVVVQTGGDLGEVVVLGAHTQLPQRQHGDRKTDPRTHRSSQEIHSQRSAFRTRSAVRSPALKADRSLAEIATAPRP